MTMPSMPSVSSPTISPPSAPVIRQNESTPSKKGDAESKKSESAKTDAAAQSKTLTASSLINLNSLIAGGSLSSLNEDNNTNSMNSLLSLSNLITGKSDINDIISNSQTGTLTSSASSNTSLIILNQILEQLSQLNEELEQLKKENSTLSQTEQTQLHSEKTESRIKLLRFSVNGYSVLDTCKTIYFSTPDRDGSFLCTADREYYADGILRKETFYMLFTSIGNNVYNTAVKVVQDYLHEYSFVYQLAQKENLQAVRTGNLMSLIIDEKNWKMDFLIDLYR